MPIYEYKCAKCDAHFEKLQKSSDQALTVCENCGGELVKQWSLSGFQFKGDGWYVTDYAKKSGVTASPTSEKSENKESSESTEKTKPASKEKSLDTPKKEKVSEEK